MLTDDVHEQYVGDEVGSVPLDPQYPPDSVVDVHLIWFVVQTQDRTRPVLDQPHYEHGQRRTHYAILNEEPKSAKQLHRVEDDGRANHLVGDRKYCPYRASLDLGYGLA